MEHEWVKSIWTRSWCHFLSLGLAAMLWDGEHPEEDEPRLHLIRCC